MKLGLSIVALAITGIAGSVEAAEECVNSRTHLDTCEMARTVERSLTPQLPMKVGKDFKLREIAADQGNIEIALTSDEKLSGYHVHNYIDNKTMSDVRTKLHATLDKDICMNEAIGNFIVAGGKVHYFIFSRDRLPVADFMLFRCPTDPNTPLAQSPSSGGSSNSQKCRKETDCTARIGM